MRKIRLITALGILWAFVLVAPTFGQFGPTCKQADVDLVAVKEKPGDYVGSFTGSIRGAVSLSTLKETIQPDGTIVSLIEMTYVSPRGDAGLYALLDVTDIPADDGGYARTAKGQIVEGKGEYAGVTGLISMDGRLSRNTVRLKAAVEIQLCR